MGQPRPGLRDGWTNQPRAVLVSWHASRRDRGAMSSVVHLDSDAPRLSHRRRHHRPGHERADPFDCVGVTARRTRQNKPTRPPSLTRLNDTQNHKEHMMFPLGAPPLTSCSNGSRAQQGGWGLGVTLQRRAAATTAPQHSLRTATAATSSYAQPSPTSSRRTSRTRSERARGGRPNRPSRRGWWCGGGWSRGSSISAFARSKQELRIRGSSIMGSLCR